MSSSVLVFSIEELGIGSLLSELLELPQSARGLGCWVSLKGYSPADRLFERIPEPPMAEDLARRVLVGLEYVADSYAWGLLRCLGVYEQLAAEKRSFAFTFAFHAGLTADAAAAQLSGDGCDVIRYPAWSLARSRPAPVAERIDSIRNLSNDPRWLPIVDALATGKAPVDVRGQASTLLRALSPESWAWNAVDHRILDMLAQPELVRWRPNLSAGTNPDTDLAVDRAGVLRNELARRGVIEEELLDAACKYGNFNISSNLLWLAGQLDRLDELIERHDRVCPTHAIDREVSLGSFIAGFQSLQLPVQDRLSAALKKSAHRNRIERVAKKHRVELLPLLS